MTRIRQPSLQGVAQEYSVLCSPSSGPPQVRRELRMFDTMQKLAH